MGQKVHPYGFRVGYIYDWKSRWFAKKSEFPKMLLEDVKIRKFIKKALATAAVSKIEVERSSDKVRVLIFSARPGIIIGRRGSEIEKLKEELHSITGKEVIIDIKDIKNANTDAQLVAENIAFQIEKRIPHKRAMKKAIQSARDLKIANEWTRKILESLDKYDHKSFPLLKDPKQEYLLEPVSPTALAELDGTLMLAGMRPGRS